MTLLSSTCSQHAFLEVKKRLNIEGNIVIGVGIFVCSGYSWLRDNK